jgi:hypothetical protein
VLKVVVGSDFFRCNNNFWLEEEKQVCFPETGCSSSFKETKNPLTE